MIGKNKLNSSWQDINLEISGVVAPIHNEFESELSQCQTPQRFDREGNWRKWLCNPAIVLARSSSPQEQGSLPGMADSAAFICPQCLLAFPCLAGVARTLQSSARSVLGIQAFCSLGRGRNGVVTPAGSIMSSVPVAERRAGLSKPRVPHSLGQNQHQTPPVVGACAMPDAGTRMGGVHVAAIPPGEPHSLHLLHINHWVGGKTGFGAKLVIPSSITSLAAHPLGKPCGVTCHH